jgi:hypothetical protein
VGADHGIGDLEYGLAGCDTSLVAHRENLATRHRVHELGARRLVRREPAGDAAVAQHGHLVAHREHLVDLVRHEHDGGSRVGGATDDGEQRRHLARGEHGGRLVEDEDGGVAVQRLQDLDALALARGERRHACARVDREAVASAEFANARFGRATVEQPESSRLRTEHHVGRDRHRVEEAEVLVHHPDSRGDRLEWAGEGHGSAIDVDLAAVCRDEAEQDRHERRLARTVLTHDGMDRAPAQNEIDAVVGEDGAEALADRGQLDGGPSHPAVSGSVTVMSPATIWSRMAATFSRTSG